MVKECKILLNNKIRNVIVFDYDGIKVQINADLPESTKTVFVKREGNLHKIVSKEEYEKMLRANERKIRKVKEVSVAESDEESADAE